MSSTPTLLASSSIFKLDDLCNNPVFAGGIGLAGLGAAAAFARRAVIRGAALLKRQMLVKVEVSKADASYPWLLAWIALARDDSTFLARRLTRLHDLSVATSVRYTGGNETERHGHADFRIQPGFGSHLLRHAPGVYIAVKRDKAGTAVTQTGEPHETLTLTLLWAHRHVLADVFTEAHALAQQYTAGKTLVYAAQKMNWLPLGKPRVKRPLGSVVLDDGVSDRIVRDVRDFLAAKKWYVDRGVPYRRGYLLHGPPGTGKTSFIQALAGELDYNIAMVNLNERGISDDQLARLLTDVPERSILLLEDVDVAVVNRRQPEADGYTGPTVTYSGLLNALDGLAAGEDRILFMTTNHVDRLDRALIRPGRVDMMVRIGEATRYQAAEMWDRYYADLDPDHSARPRFLYRLQELGLLADAEQDAKVPSRPVSTAAIQGLFQFNKGDMEGAIKMVGALLPATSEPEMPHRQGTAKPS